MRDTRYQFKHPVIAAATLGVLACCGAADAQIIYNNGGAGTMPGIVTATGVGPFAGNAVSQASTDTNNGGATVSGAYRLADDFTLTADANLSQIGVFAYITGGYADPNASPFTGISVNIWNAIPGSVGASVVVSSSTMASTSWSGVTRHFDGPANLADGRRPVMQIVAAFSGQTLPAGTYWLDFAVTGQLGASTMAFSPYLMSGEAADRQTVVGNALQFRDGSWGLMAIGSQQQNVDVPFFISVPTPAAAALLSLGGLVATRRRR